MRDDQIAAIRQRLKYLDEIAAEKHVTLPRRSMADQLALDLGTWPAPPASREGFTQAERAAWLRGNRIPNKAWPGVLSRAVADDDGLYLPQDVKISKGIGWQHVGDDKQLRPAHGAEFYPTDLGIALAALARYQSDRPAPGRILDMGAGTGVWGQAARMLWPSAVIVGIELRNVMSAHHGNIDPTLPTFDPDQPPPTVATASRTVLAPDYDVWITGSISDPTALALATAHGAFDLIMGNPPFSFAPGIVEWAWNEGLDPDAGRLFMLLRGAFLESRERDELNKACPLARFMVFVKRPSFTQDGKTDATMYALFEWDRTWRDPWFKGYRFNHEESSNDH